MLLRILLPLLVYFISIHLIGPLIASIFLCVVMVALLIEYRLTSRLLDLPMVIAPIVMVVFITLTALSQFDWFLKTRVTIIATTLAIILFVGLYKNKGLLQYVFGYLIELHSYAWCRLSRRAAWCLMLIALLNEIIHRNYSDESWQSYISYGIIAILTFFVVLNISYIRVARIETLYNSHENIHQAKFLN